MLSCAYKGGGSLTLSDNELVEDMLRYAQKGYDAINLKWKVIRVLMVK